MEKALLTFTVPNWFIEFLLEELFESSLRLGTLPKDGLPKDELPKVALPKDELPKVALPKVALPKDEDSYFLGGIFNQILIKIIYKYHIIFINIYIKIKKYVYHCNVLPKSFSDELSDLFKFSHMTEHVISHYIIQHRKQINNMWHYLCFIFFHKLI